jgi:patatin-like phospholipase/acyl hydrolase
MNPHQPPVEFRRNLEKGVRILTLDGGGIRALVTLRLLEEIERRTGKRIWELFDFIGCTSTGGILASLAFIRKIPLRECAKKYREFGRKVFSGNGDKDILLSDSNWTKFMNYVNWMSSGGIYGSDMFVETLRGVCGGERMIDTMAGDVIFFPFSSLFFLLLSF